MTLTLHPEVIDRGYRLNALDDMLDELRSTVDLEFSTHAFSPSRTSLAVAV